MIGGRPHGGDAWIDPWLFENATQSRPPTHFSRHGSYPIGGWSDSISDYSADREGAAMNQLETGEVLKAAQAVSDFQDELAEVLQQRAAISAVLRAIASSPHDLQPIFDTILDSARRLSRADTGVFRLVEEAGFRLVAYKLRCQKCICRQGFGNTAAF